MTLARDTALASGVLVIAIAVGVATDAAFAPTAVVAGALLAVGLEVLASARAAVVERVWASLRVRAGAVVLAVGAAVVAAVVAPTWGVSALVGGLVAYLALVALVALGVLPPSTAWFDATSTDRPR